MAALLGNRTEVRTDELGVVVAMAVMGKVGSSDGDTLEDPTVMFEYDLGRFGALGLPSVVHAVAREEHGPANTRFQHSYTYFDGAGLEAMRKVQAEPGLAPKRDEHGELVHEDGELVWEHADPRWVGTGRTIWNNKGLPIKQYEPFFSATHEYEDEAEVVESGVTPLFHYDPLGRLIRTDLPNGSYSKVVFGPWQQTTWDPNDTVFDPADPEHTRSAWYEARVGLPAGPEKRAATLAAAHAGTTTVAELDVLGRGFRTTQDAGAGNKPTTNSRLDIEGNLLALTDARGIVAETGVFAMGGAKLKQTSVDAGSRWMLSDVLGQPLRRWDERGHALRSTYDALRRPLELFVAKDADPEVLAENTVWGEGHVDALAKNLRGRPFQRYDGAGVVTSEAYDFKGNLLASSRRLRSDYAGPANWPFIGLSDIDAILAASEASLELESFASATIFDALNRPTSLTTPDASEVRPSYNEAGLLEAVDVRVRDDASWTSIVDSIDYDAKGQRERIVYGNGTRTECTYDPETFRLTRLKTLRDSDSAVLQDVRYTYDPIGNIVAIEDTAQQTVFFDNAVVTPSTLYEYDPLYRLTSATGREHAGGLGDDQRDQNDLPINNLPHFNDGQALRNYTERYTYDAVGNILRMIHDAGMVGSWTRGYRVAEDSKCLLATSLAGDDLEDPADYSAKYTPDAHGNMVAMPHLEEMGWDFKDQMVYADKGGGGEVYFTYDAAGQRVRKVWEHSGLVEERIYLGSYEVYRRRNGSGLVLERQTLHLMDGEKRVAMVETKTVDTSEPALVVTPRLRYQLGNHLGSALLEVDETGRVISYEEYHPYGTSAYRSARSGVEVSAKRYRYTGKERDEETGLYYHGARYYAAWLGRWTAADPAGIGADGPCLYAYVRGNPVRLADPSGREAYGFGSASGIDAIDQVMIRGSSGAPTMGEPRFASDEVAAQPVRASDFEPSPAGPEFGSPEHIEQIRRESIINDVMRGQAEWAKRPDTLGAVGMVGTGVAAVVGGVAAIGAAAPLTVLGGAFGIAFGITGAAVGTLSVGTHGGLNAEEQQLRDTLGAMDSPLKLPAYTLGLGVTGDSSTAEGVAGVVGLAESLYRTAVPLGIGTERNGAGRARGQQRLRDIAREPNTSSADRGWIQQELNSIERGQRTTIRNPPGKQLAHTRGREATKGYDHVESPSNLQDTDLHRTQHKFDGFGRRNKERP